MVSLMAVLSKHAGFLADAAIFGKSFSSFFSMRHLHGMRLNAFEIAGLTAAALAVCGGIVVAVLRRRAARRRWEEDQERLRQDTEERMLLAEALKQREHILTALLGGVHDGVILTDPRGNVVDINETAERLTGWTRRAALGRPARTVFAAVREVGREPVEDPVALAVRDGQGASGQAILIHRESGELPVEHGASAIRDDAGQVTGIALIFREVAGQRALERAELTAHQRIEAVLESMSDAFVSLDRDWRITYINQAAARLNEKPREASLGRSHWDEWPETVGTEVERQYRKAMRLQAPVHFEHRFVIGGHELWLEIHAYPAREGLSLFYRDVTARKKAEALLLESEQRFRVVADTMPQIVWTMHPNGSVEYLNRQWATYTGLPTDPPEPEEWLALIHPDDRERFETAWLEAVRYKRPYEIEYRLKRHDGVYRWNLGRCLPVRSERGELVVWVGSGTDIDDQKQAETVLRQRAEQLASLNERERNISMQLQDALRPPIPRTVPGLVLAHHYTAALDEAGVGGDFTDVYALDSRRTALVVGDVSGKGLAAAAQVATVRNMLRYVLYRDRDLPRAMADLNRVLSANDLLSGFATLFAGIYDGDTRVLTYVSCGQEPALVHRKATGAVDLLPPTGPVLGGWADAEFQEGQCSLSPGDMMAIFTDGMTETGPDREDLVGPEGVAALFLAEIDARLPETELQRAQRIVSGLVNSVDEYARGGVRDDLCVLLLIAQK